MSSIIVSIICNFYNHAAYAQKTIESFLNQETNFEYEILLHDDCSQDGTADIVSRLAKAHPQKIKAILQTENQFKKGINNWSVHQFPRAKGKYLALCDGDDYWLNTSKLQTQVNFLEENPDYSLCSALYNVEQNGKIEKPSFLDKLIPNGQGWYEISIDNFLNPYVLKTMCAVFRRDLLNHHLYTKKYYSDLFVWADLLTKGKGACLNFVGGVYRLHNTGIWSGLNDIGKATENYYLAKEMESTFNYQYKSLKDFRINQQQHLYTLLKEKKQLTSSEKKLIIELISKKVIAKVTRFLTSKILSSK